MDDVLVVCDDFNLDLGLLRLRGSGSSGGQKGLQNIIERCGTEKFPRLRIGIGQPPKFMQSPDFVLSRFRENEREIIDKAIGDAATGIELWIKSGLSQAMNTVNRPVDPPSAAESVKP